ncbi:MAG: sigma-70 family RNA polymerase sigma factor [Phycisphaerales bacterium]|nr:sigma-70 family RNA polymerase sigma factor [Phycisphaerales bacterium]
MPEAQASCNDERRHERQLIARARRGDQRALRELIDGHKNRLHAFVSRMVRNHHDAEEVVQDAFLRAFASLDSFSTEYRFSTWLFTIGYRLCLNALRRKQSLTGEFDFATVPDGSDGIDRRTAESDEAAHLRSIVWRAVDRLSPQQRATVVLFYRHDHSCQDIALVLELPVATVKSHLHRARQRLRELLQPAVTSETTKLRILAGLAG